jgi:hypothetical protein
MALRFKAFVIFMVAARDRKTKTKSTFPLSWIVSRLMKCLQSENCTRDREETIFKIRNDLLYWNCEDKFYILWLISYRKKNNFAKLVLPVKKSASCMTVWSDLAVLNILGTYLVIHLFWIMSISNSGESSTYSSSLQDKRLSCLNKIKFIFNIIKLCLYNIGSQENPLKQLRYI